MSEILVVCKENQLGDSLMCAPALCKLAEKYDTVFYAWRNRDIQAIMDIPGNCIDVMDHEPLFNSMDMPVQMLGVGAALNYDPCGSPIHAIKAVYNYAGLGIPEQVPEIKIKTETFNTIFSTDIALGLWTTAKERTMTWSQAFKLTNILDTFDYSTVNIGESNNPRLESSFNLLGGSFAMAADAFRKAKIAITVDTFQLHLAHAAGVKHHIILDSTVTPWTSQGYGPNCIRVNGWRECNGQAVWNIDDIVRAVHKCF